MKTHTIKTLAALLAIPLAASASTWNGTSSTDWGTATNWSTDPNLPASGDNITIADTTSNNLTLDADRTIGSLTFGDTGTRTAGFTLSTGAANILTLNGGLSALGNLGQNPLILTGNITIGDTQTWTINGTPPGNLGQTQQANGIGVRGDFTIDEDLTLAGTGALNIQQATISGDGDIIVNQGGLRLYGNANTDVNIGGTGKIVVNDGAYLTLARSSGEVNITRDIVMNGNSTLAATGTGNGSYAANIAWNGTHTLRRGFNNHTFTGDWTGSGTVNRTGEGIITLSGDNSAFSGNLILSEGILEMGADNATGTGTLVFAGGSMRSDATRAISNDVQAQDATTSELINGGSGDLMYSGDFTGTGTLSVDSGASRSIWLQGDGSGFEGTISYNVLTNGTNLRLGGNPGFTSPINSTNGSDWSQTQFVLSGTGTNRQLSWNGLANATVKLGELSGTGGTIGISFNARAANWEIGHLNTDSTFEGIIEGANNALTKVGTGTLTLTGDNTYTGATTVAAGVLVVNGSLGATATTVQDTATLAGSGSIGGSVTVEEGGTLSPGNSIESLAVGNLSMAAGSTFVFEAEDNSATGADLLVAGTLSLTDVTLDLDGADLAAASWIIGDKLTLISYTGSAISSGFSGFDDNTTYNFGSNEWLFLYADTQKGNNFADDANGDQFVTMTMIPEPSTALFALFGFAALLRRRRA